MDIPQNLTEQIAQGNCVSFLGSGPSLAAGLPSWPRLLRLMIVWGEGEGVDFSDKAEIERFITDGSYLVAAEELVDRLGDDSFRRFMVHIFGSPGLLPTQVHLLLAQIPFAAQVTTNYEILSEKGYEATHGILPTMFTQTDVPQLSTALRSGEFYILKSHGTIDRIETIVLGRKQYRSVMHGNPAYRIFLETLFSTKTVLFVGFGLTDPDLLMTLDVLQAAFHGHTGAHYALMDESRVSPIERSRFSKDYKIEIIPYKPSSADHPEVREFLERILKAVPAPALRHKLGQVEKLLADADTHYKLVANTEGEYIIKEKFPGAAKEKPLPFSVELRFDKKTQEGREAGEAWQKHIDTGEEITIKSPHLSNFIPPELVSRFLPLPTDEMEMTIGPRRGETKIPINIVIESAGGRTESLDNIVLEEIRRGEKEITLNNENQKSPWKVQQILVRDDFKQSTFTIHFSDVGLNVKQALDGWRFWQALSEGGVVTIEWQETGQRFGQTKISPGIYPATDPGLIELLEGLVLIQRVLGVRFESPDYVSNEDARLIFIAAQILGMGRADLTPEPVLMDSHIDQAREIVQAFEGAATKTISSYVEDVSFTVLSKQLSFGPMATTREVHLPSEQLQKLKDEIEMASAEQVFHISLVPVDSPTPSARFPDWLRKEESKELRNLPFVRAATLKSLLRILFDAAKTSGDGFETNEFMALLEAARSQVSEDGEPLNALPSCTTEELLVVFEPLVAELDSNARLALAAKLSASGWLPVGESAALFSVDKDIIQAAVQRSNAASRKA